jgi:hypothetical protein
LTMNPSPPEIASMTFISTVNGTLSSTEITEVLKCLGNLLPHSSVVRSVEKFQDSDLDSRKSLFQALSTLHRPQFPHLLNVSRWGRQFAVPPMISKERPSNRRWTDSIHFQRIRLMRSSFNHWTSLNISTRTVCLIGT